MAAIDHRSSRCGFTPRPSSGPRTCDRWTPAQKDEENKRVNAHSEVLAAAPGLVQQEALQEHLCQRLDNSWLNEEQMTDSKDGGS